MSVEINLQAVLALIVAIVCAGWALLKLSGRQHEAMLETRFKALAEAISGVKASQQQEQATTQRLERELLELKAELPRDYVRRDDFIREFGTVLTKLDNMALRVERAVLSRGGEGL